MKISEKANRCQLSPMRKFHPYAQAAMANGCKIYQLNIGQPDLETPEAFFEAVQAFHQNTLAYAPSPGIPVLIDAVRRYYHGFSVNFEREDVLITTGGSEALLFALMSILDPGDEIIIPEPYYPNYSTFVTAAGGRIRPLQTSPEEGYFFADRQRIEALINEHTRAILFSNPGNPTGTVLNTAQMQLLADIAKEHQLYLIADEVYREFCYADQDRIPTMAALPGLEENLILIDSVSKRFSACGARVGALITRNKALQQAVMKFCQARLSVATLDQIAAAALYDVDASYFARMREVYQSRRDTLVRKLRAIPGVTFEVPQGAFYLMAELPVDDADRFQKWLLTEFRDHNETVMFAPGAPFYATPGKGIREIRIAYVLQEKDLERAVELLGLGIAAYQKTQM